MGVKSQNLIKCWHYNQILALALRLIAIGSLMTVPALLTAQTLTAARHNPCP